MVPLFKLGGKKELSIPLLMGVILYALTFNNKIIIISGVYALFTAFLGEYQNELDDILESDKIDMNKFFSAMSSLFSIKLYVGENKQARLLRGIIVSSLFVILSQTYITHQAIVYLIENFTNTNIMLALLLTTTYSTYSLFNYMAMFFFAELFERSLDKLAEFFDEYNEEDLENINLD